MQTLLRGPIIYTLEIEPGNTNHLEAEDPKYLSNDIRCSLYGKPNAVNKRWLALLHLVN